MAESKQKEVPPAGTRKIRKITIENFMSHERTELEFADGITLLSGGNNCGKSAVVVALRAICGMTRGNWMVRHDEKQANVTLQLENEDGSFHEVEWRRKKTTHGWTVDGVESDRRIHEDIHEILRMGIIKQKIGTGSFDVHFAPQKDPIFLLNDPGSRAAEFFTTAGDAQLLFAMKKKLKSKKTEANGRLTQCEREIAVSKERMEVLKEVPCLVTSVTALSKRRSELVEEGEKTSALYNARRELLSAGFASKRCKDRFDALEILPEVPETSDTERMEAELQDIANSAKDLSSLLQKVDALEVLPSSPQLEETSAFLEVIKNIRTWRDAFEVAEETLEVLEVLPDSEPDVADTSGLQARIAELRARTSELRERENELKKIEDDLVTVQSSWVELMNKNPKCPTCGTVLDEKHLEGLHDQG